MASILRVNTLTDTSSNNSIATSFIFAGSAKNWNNVAGDGTSFNDSFNTSSLTDNATGVHTVNYTSNMVNNRASLTACHQYTTASGTGAFLQNSSTRTTSSHRHDHYENGSSADPAVYNTTLHGDLA